MTEKEQLLEEAKKYGLEFPKNAKVDTIKSAIAQAKEEQQSAEAYVEAGGTIDETPKMTEAEMRAKLEDEFKQKLEEEKRRIQANLEVNLAKRQEEDKSATISIGQVKLKARREAMALKRVVVTPKDPAKQNYEGEIFTVSNDVVGDVKKYVPYNLDAGYHVPKIILDALRSKECTIFVNKKGPDGKSVQEAKIIKAYQITELPPLTKEELEELGREQAARQAID